MCGRFALALPPAPYRAAVDDWIARREAQGRPVGPRQDEQQAPRRPRGRFAPAGSRGAQEVASPVQSQEEHVVTDSSSAGKPRLSVTPSPTLETGYHPTTNMAPTSFVPVLFQSPTSSELILEPMRWGLLPAPTKSIPRGGDMIKTINARSDTILSGRGLWSPLFKQGKRGVVFVQGFYEWQKTPQARLPHFVGMLQPGKGRTDAQGQSKEIMPLAALWEECTLETGEKLKTFTICTTDSNAELSFLHDRMPVILPTLAALKIWLGLPTSSSSDSPASLLRPYDDPLAFYRIPTEVGKTGTDDRKFLLPIAARKDGIEAAFGRVKRSRQGEDNESSGKGKKVKREDDGAGDSNAPIDRSTKKMPIGTQDTDELDAEALLEATKRVEEDVALDTAALQVEAAAARGDANQLEADRKLAERMQREWEEEERKVTKTGSAVAQAATQPDASDDTEAETRAGPSSKFSPEPFNPPLSPSTPTRNKAGSSSNKAGGSKLEQMLETQRKKAANAPKSVTPKKARNESDNSASSSKKKGDIRPFFSPAS